MSLTLSKPVAWLGGLTVSVSLICTPVVVAGAACLLGTVPPYAILHACEDPHLLHSAVDLWPVTLVAAAWGSAP